MILYKIASVLGPALAGMADVYLERFYGVKPKALPVVIIKYATYERVQQGSTVFNRDVESRYEIDILATAKDTATEKADELAALKTYEIFSKIRETLDDEANMLLGLKGLIKKVDYSMQTYGSNRDLEESDFLRACRVNIEVVHSEDAKKLGTYSVEDIKSSFTRAEDGQLLFEVTQ